MQVIQLNKNYRKLEGILSEIVKPVIWQNTSRSFGCIVPPGQSNVAEYVVRYSEYVVAMNVAVVTY